MRLTISLFVFVVFCCNVVAQSEIAVGELTIDTLYAHVDDQHNTYFQYESHTAVPSSELAQRFHVREYDMLLKHTRLSDDTIGLHRTVLIPFAASDLMVTRSATVDCVPVVYTVRKKETLFKIARRYFDIKVDQLRTFNNMSSNDISINQQLIVGWYVLHPVTETVHEAGLSTSHVEPVDPFYPEVPKQQIGLAFWNKSQENTSHMFAMHNSARINSLIEITNPMFKSKVLVKVVGRIPPTYTKDIALIVSPAVAKKLGVLDPRFRAEMRFVE